MTATGTVPTPAQTVKRGLPLGHSVCIYCYPQTPAPGVVALCGHVCLGIAVPRGILPRCVVCDDLVDAHYAAHRKA